MAAMHRALFILPLLSSGALAGACDNAIKPMQTGWVYTYRDTSKDGVALFEMRRSLTANGYTDTYTTPGKPPSLQSFRCEGGAHINVTAPSVAGATVTRLSITGVSFPAPAAWKTGYDWTYTMKLEGRKSGLNARATITFNYQILSRENVTVAAGTFDAWKVGISGTIDAHVAFVPIRQQFTETQWIVPGVGIVKISRPNSGSELVSLKK